MSRIGNLLQNLLVNFKRLFHLLIALAFMLLTLMGASVTYGEWENYRRAPGVRLAYYTMLGCGVFTLFLAILSVYSYAKARSVR